MFYHILKFSFVAGQQQKFHDCKTVVQCITSSIDHHCRSVSGTGNTEPKSKSSKGQKGNSSGNNWVHSPERNFEFVDADGTNLNENQAQVPQAAVDFGSEPRNEFQAKQGIVFMQCICMVEGD